MIVVHLVMNGFPTDGHGAFPTLCARRRHVAMAVITGLAVLSPQYCAFYE